MIFSSKTEKIKAGSSSGRSRVLKMKLHSQLLQKIKTVNDRRKGNLSILYTFSGFASFINDLILAIPKLNVHKLDHKREQSSQNKRIRTMPDNIKQILASYLVSGDTVAVYTAENICILIYHAQTFVQNTNKIYKKHLLCLKG